MQDLIIYNTPDGKTSVALYASDGDVWLTRQQIAELFGTSVPNISMHVSNILKDNELTADSVVKKFLTTASDGKGVAELKLSVDTIRMRRSRQVVTLLIICMLALPV